MARSKDETGTAVEELRAFGLGYPGAHTKSPWPGHLDLAVNDKTFAYLSVAGEPLTISCKLPRSAEAALSLPFTNPTAYGLGKSGWVTATFPDGMPVPVELLREWIDESYRAQAPKRLSAGLAPLGVAGDVPALSLGSSSPGAASGSKPVAKSAASKRSTVKQATRGAAAASGAGRARAPAGTRAPARRAAALSRSGSAQPRASTGAKGRHAPLDGELATKRGRAGKRPAKKVTKRRVGKRSR